MKTSATTIEHPWLKLLKEPAVLGTVAGLLSAIGYTAANIMLREVAHCDPVWVSCVKAMPTVVLFSPWLLVRFLRGQPIVPPARALVVLVAAAILGQLGGNVIFQWSLGVVGIALAVPLTLGSMIVTGALLGRIFLLEPIHIRSAISISVLVAAIFILSRGAGEAYQSVALVTGMGAGWSSWWLIVAGVAAACLSGLAYSVLGVVIRRGVTRDVAISSTLVTVCLVGTLGLGAISLWRLGPEGLRATAPRDFAFMVGAGLFNALAFLCLIKSLQLATVLYVNALNATQATMAVIAGVLFFDEPVSGALLAGVTLTILGLLLMRGKPRARGEPPSLEQTKTGPTSLEPDLAIDKVR